MLLLFYSFLLSLRAINALSIALHRDTLPLFIYSGDAPCGVPSSNLSSILTCPNGYPDASSKPVLLIHGTGSTGEES